MGAFDPNAFSTNAFDVNAFSIQGNSPAVQVSTPDLYVSLTINEPLALSTGIGGNVDRCVTIIPELVKYACINPVVEYHAVLGEPLNKSTRIVGPIAICKPIQLGIYKGACLNG
jgi:hypothetical protein